MRKSIKNQISEGFREYVQNLGEKSILKAPDYTNSGNLFNDEYLVDCAANAVISIREQYDLGVSLAKDGLWLGYLFNIGGLPVSVIKASRKGTGAEFKPINDFNRKLVKGKRVLFFDLDCVTGRTINRAADEVLRYNPENMDVIFLHHRSVITVDTYKKFSGRGVIPSAKEWYTTTRDTEIIKEIWNSDGIELVLGDKGNTFNDLYYGAGYYQIIKKSNDESLFTLPIERNCFEKFGKVFSLCRDFNVENKKRIKDFEKEVENHGK